jgi:hypothetical protein
MTHTLDSNTGHSLRLPLTILILTITVISKYKDLDLKVSRMWRSDDINRAIYNWTIRNN